MLFSVTQIIFSPTVLLFEDQGLNYVYLCSGTPYIFLKGTGYCKHQVLASCFQNFVFLMNCIYFSLILLNIIFFLFIMKNSVHAHK